MSREDILRISATSSKHRVNSVVCRLKAITGRSGVSWSAVVRAACQVHKPPFGQDLMFTVSV